MPDYSIKRFSKYSDDELIGLLREYAQTANKSYVSSSGFFAATGIAETTITNHFGTWKTFCEKAGRYERTLDRARLFENLDLVWQALGHEPKK